LIGIAAARVDVDNGMKYNTAKRPRNWIGVSYSSFGWICCCCCTGAAESPAARSKYSAASAMSFSDTDGVGHPFASRTHRSA
jgi:hypothetical protein